MDFECYTSSSFSHGSFYVVRPKCRMLRGLKLFVIRTAQVKHLDDPVLSQKFPRIISTNYRWKAFRFRKPGLP